jgi:hypothetical protein
MIFDKVLTFEISANAVAWYGAIIATLSIIITLLSYFRDRGNIKVKLSQGFLAYGPTLGQNVQIFIEAINTGRRPITLNGAGLYLKNKMQIVAIEQEQVRFPYELQEGKSTQIWMEKDYIFQQVAKQKTKIMYAWYRDATGKIYKARFFIKNSESN